MNLKKLNNGTLVFVPGIMGSELRLRGIDSSGVPRDEMVWGGDFASMWSTIARDPEVLASPDLVATGVIRSIRLGWYSMQEVYGPLLSFCCSRAGLGLQEGATFRAFAYDWRKDLMATASELGRFIQDLPQPVFVVAHSMGGIVTRLMLSTNAHATTIVKGVLQIASPVEGSTKAYVTLRKEPSLGKVADALWKVYHQLDPARRARLMDAIANMESLYQILPPASRRILLKAGGTDCSAVDPSVWQPRDQGFVAKAAMVHNTLATAPATPIKCLYGVGHDTDWLLAVNDHWKIIGTKLSASGDGTVTSSSAIAVSNVTLSFNGRSSEHTKLCSRSEVHAELQGFLA